MDKNNNNGKRGYSRFLESVNRGVARKRQQMQKAKWLDYEFSVHGINAPWKDVSGIYMFCGVSSQNTWVPIYIGQALSFADRLGNHDRWDEAAARGATAVHAMVVPTQAQRDLVEARLILAYQPALNTHLK